MGGNFPGIFLGGVGFSTKLCGIIPGLGKKGESWPLKKSPGGFFPPFKNLKGPRLVKKSLPLYKKGGSREKPFFVFKHSTRSLKQKFPPQLLGAPGVFREKSGFLLYPGGKNLGGPFLFSSLKGPPSVF